MFETVLGIVSLARHRTEICTEARYDKKRSFQINTELF